ncbi:ABC-2 type transport system permease protein [Streptomyces sp. LBL]|uniref:ABC transporter permease n=1 Tax=Streptomyces sp. LBL TaxID=2940562 RepID=UPI002475E9A0|nr:ABC transporter permease [Streptomyces sp. LBL]MDH6628464.1 ABC-2 type transport system permease protein [Streptomyces sp. LBL]
MSSISYGARDSVTMFRRNMKRAIRYPSVVITIVMMPVLFLLLFNYAFGGALGAGIQGPQASTGDHIEHIDYIDYIAPGIILMTVATGCIGAALSVCMDMTEGIVNRFRTMSISRASFLTGHVLGSLVQTLLGTAVVTGVALAIGFRPDATPLEWLAVLGLLSLLALALTWLSAGMGLVAKTVESASNMPMPITLLPFLGSAIVPTDSMPSWMRWFADYQPFTPINETLRGLLMGTEIGNSGWISLTWCAGIGLTGYLWSKAAFKRGVRS